MSGNNPSDHSSDGDFDDKSPEALARLLGTNPAALAQLNNTDPALPEYDLASYDPNTAVPRNESEKQQVGAQTSLPVHPRRGVLESEDEGEEEGNLNGLEERPPRYEFENSSNLSLGAGTMTAQVPSGLPQGAAGSSIQSASTPTLDIPAGGGAGQNTTSPHGASTSGLPILPQNRIVKRLFISQRGNAVKPWPFANSSELETPVLDADKKTKVYTSTRFKRSSGTCVLRRVSRKSPEGGKEEAAGLSGPSELPSEPVVRPVEFASGEVPRPVELEAPTSPAAGGGSAITTTVPQKQELEVTTTYFFGPGNDPIISFQNEAGLEVQIGVHGKGIKTRTRYFEFKGEWYEWRYIGKYEAEGMVLERVVTLEANNVAATPEPPEGSGKGAETTTDNVVEVEEGEGVSTPTLSTTSTAIDGATPAAAAGASCGNPPKSPNGCPWKDKNGTTQKDRPKPYKWKGKGKSKRKDDDRPGTSGTTSTSTTTSSSASSSANLRIPVAQFIRDEETAKPVMGLQPAGHGGWISFFDQAGGEGEGEGEGGEKVNGEVDEEQSLKDGREDVVREAFLPEWLALATCLVMLKRERDRRTMHIGLAMSGAIGL